MSESHSLLMRFLILTISSCLLLLLLSLVPVNAQFASNQEQIGSSPSTTIGAQEIMTMTPVQLDGRTLFTGSPVEVMI